MVAVMPRRTKAELAASNAETNRLAALIPTGTTYESGPFATVTLGENKGANWDGDGLDLYTVNHSGLNHGWSSASVVAAFTA